jgi:hypothetical protein
MSVALVHPRERCEVSAAQLILKCTVFKSNLALLSAPYAVKSSVSLEVFREFLSALDGFAVAIGSANFAGLSLLCAEFGFEGLRERLSEFRRSADFAGEAGETADAEARARIAALEARALERDRETAVLQAEFGRLSAAVESLRGAVASGETEARALRGDQARIEADAVRVSAAVEGLRSEVLALRVRPATLPPASPSARQTAPPSASAAPASAIPPLSPPPPTDFDSLIVADFPALFAEFGGKCFTLLWRGSRDGFGVRDFHSRCDGHAPTLTLIEDTTGNIFGGFTPVEWESRTGNWFECMKADPSLMSFLFTLKNPHNFPARKFGLKIEMKSKAIYCNSSYGPCFYDIAVRDPYDARSSSSTILGYSSYANDTGLDETTFFTGSQGFTTKEIEVFEITD